MTPLEDLLQQCTVKITVPGGWGTGFFVATGLILTCAHVVRKAVDLQVTVSCPAWQQPLSAIVKARADDGKTLDLALVELSEPLPDHPCVLLDDEPVAIGQALYSYGYLESYTNAAPVRPVNEGLTGDMPPLLKLQGAQIERGISGAALLNLKTGKVCGMVKETRAAGFDLGGGAIPTRVILEQFPELRSLQREFHGSDRRWINLITQPGIDFQPYLQAILANEDYREWQDLYTPTTVEDRRRIPEQETTIASQRRFSSRLKLRAEIVKPDKQEQGDQPNGLREPQERVEQWDVLAGLRNYAVEHVVLSGKPGSGKSTSLKRLLWEEAEKALQDPNARIPVLVKLRRCTGTLEGLIRDLVGHQVALEIAQIEKLLRQGRFLLLLDGLNELPEAFRTEVANFRDRYRTTTPMIVSTRDFGGGGTLGIEKTLKMLPLTEPQMREFVRGYLGEEGDRLFQKLQEDRLRKFAETPLLLWMLCRVFAHNGKVPDNLGFAFREFAQLHDQECQADVPVDSKDQWHRLLRHLAFVMMQGKTAIDPQLSIPREEAEDRLTAYLRQEDRSNPREHAERWLKDLLKYHLIQPVIQPNFEEHIEFRHQLIQEYYAAEYLLKLLPNLTDDQLKREYLNYLKWTEPVALMLALLNNEEQAVRVMKLALGIDHWLGARLSGEVKPEFQMQTIKFVEDLEVPDWLKVELLEETRSEYSIEGLLQLAEDADAGARGSAVEALGKMDTEAVVPGLLKLLEDADASARWRAAKALGQIGSESAIPGLLKALEHSKRDMRRRVTAALGQIGSELAAAEALGKIGSEAAIPGLLKAIEDSNGDVRWGAAKALGQIGSESAIPGLLKAIEDSDEYVRSSAAEALGKIGSQVAIPSLFKAIEDSDCKVCRSAVKALGKIGSETAIPGLLKAIEHSDRDVRENAAKTLGNIGTKAVIRGLLKAMEHSDNDVRQSAAKAANRILGKIDAAAAIPEEVKAIENSDKDLVGRRLTKTLGKLGSQGAMPILLKALEHSDWLMRRSAADALGKIGSQDAIPGLLKAMKDSDPCVCRSAAMSLSKIGSEAAIPGLLKAIRYSDPYVGHLGYSDRHLRENAAEALIKIGSEAAILGLFQVLEDSNWSEVRESAAEALGKVKDDHAAHFLPNLLQLLPTKSGKEAFKAIQAIQANCKYYNYEIFQAHLAAQKVNCPRGQNIHLDTTTIQTLERLTIMTDKSPIFNQQHATIGVNYAADGSKVEFTQHTSASEQTFELLLTDYQQFIEQLQQKYPALADPTTVPQIIEVEAKLIEAQDQQRWQNFLNLKRLWNGSKKAGIKVSEHFAENNVWAKGAIAFLEGVSEDEK